MNRVVVRISASLILLGIVLLFLAGCGKTYVIDSDIAKQAVAIVENKGPWRELIPLYKELTVLEPVDSENRKKVVRYLLDENLSLINEKKGTESLEFAMELDKIIPNDFYVQNRIIGAYRVLAEDAMAKKDWQTAEDFLYKKALTIRFDVEAMRAYLTLRKLMAQEAVDQKRYTDAAKYLEEIIMIANIEDNIPLYGAEKTEAQELFGKIPKLQ